MPYATAAQMEEQFGTRELIALTDRDNVGAVDSAVLARALADADAEIDSYLAGRYTLPLAGTFPALVRHACNLARYHLSGADVTEVEAVRNRYKDAIRWLESVRDGKTRLAADAAGLPATEPARISVVGPERTFTSDTLADFHGLIGMAGAIKVPDESAGSGPSVATDDVGGRHYQIVKLAIGGDGTVTLIDAAGLPVSVASLPLPGGASTEATLAALKAVADTIATAAAAIKIAAEALNGKTTAVNTGAIAGTVAIDAGSLAALETISVANFPATQPISGNVGVLGAVEITNDSGNPIPISGAVSTGLSQPLTDTQLRASAVPVSAAALPLPSGAATDATLAALNTDLGDQADAAAGSDAGSFSLISLYKRLLGKTPALGQATMANSSPVAIASDQAAIPVTGSFSATTDFTAALLQVLRAIADPVTMDPASGRLRVMLDASGGAQTLGTVTTVGTVTTCSTVTTVATVTNQAQVGGVAANGAIYDAMDAAYAHCLRGEDRMSQAQDAVGSVVEFNLLSGPMVVNTPEGEFCADAGHVVVRYDGQKPLVLTLQQFTEQFTEI